jgi:RsiW-degrading membrane proteinase PrsW (M82 family)
MLNASFPGWFSTILVQFAAIHCRHLPTVQAAPVHRQPTLTKLLAMGLPDLMLILFLFLLQEATTAETMKCTVLSRFSGHLIHLLLIPVPTRTKEVLVSLQFMTILAR